MGKKKIKTILYKWELNDVFIVFYKKKKKKKNKQEKNKRRLTY